MRPLVTGSAGLLGSAVSRFLEERYPATVSSSREFLDLEDFWRLRAELERLEPTVVINCAACADVDGCERNPDLAYRLNRDAPLNLARACRAIGAALVHVSTDYVFDGNQSEPYGEESACQPLSIYGESKWEGECEVRREHPDSLIVRTSFLFGPGRATFLDRVLATARGGEQVRAVLDWINAPTYSNDLAAAIDSLLDRGCRGTVHVTNAGGCSKYEFARETLRLAGLDPSLVVPVRRADLSLPAMRPERTVLDLSRYVSVTGGAPRSWQEAVAAYLEASAG